MTRTDLRLNFKQETGTYPVQNEPDTIMQDNLHLYHGTALRAYIEWLEDRIIKNNQK